MSPSEHTEPATEPIQEPLALTWTFTETYRQLVPLDALAATTEHLAQEIAVDPALLLGAVGDRLADLLTGRQDPDRAVGVPEVEIIAADYDGSPRLAELVDAACTALRTESDGDQSSAAGLALAALLAWLRREQIAVR